MVTRRVGGVAWDHHCHRFVPTFNGLVTTLVFSGFERLLLCDVVFLALCLSLLGQVLFVEVITLAFTAFRVAVDEWSFATVKTIASALVHP